MFPAACLAFAAALVLAAPTGSARRRGTSAARAATAVPPWRAGACVLSPPTRGSNGVTVFVDPGHGGADSGALAALGHGRVGAEKTLVLAIGLDVRALLRRAGYAVVLSRVSDTLVGRIGPGGWAGPGVLDAAGLQADLRARVRCANARRAGVLLGIHLNAFSDPSVGGAEVIYGAARRFSAQSRSLALAVEAGVTRALAARGWKVPARGVQTDAGQGAPGLTARSRAYGHLLELGPRYAGYFRRPSRMPGVIAEPLFITNPAEARIAASPGGQWAIARGLARGVTSWLNRRPAPG